MNAQDTKLTAESACKEYSELMHIVSVGAYVEDEEDGSYWYPDEDGQNISERMREIERWSLAQDLYPTEQPDKTYKLAPAPAEVLAAYKAEKWLFSGPTSMGIRFAICDEVAAQENDGHGDLDAMRLEAVLPTTDNKFIYLIGAHFTFESEFGYPYDWWEYRAIEMRDNGVPIVRATTEEEDKHIKE